MSIKIQGIDYSPNHGASVLLWIPKLTEDPKVIIKKVWGYGTVLSAIKALEEAGGIGTHFPKPSGESLSKMRARRLMFHQKLTKELTGLIQPDYSALEDYAPGAPSPALHEIGEVGGTLKLRLWKRRRYTKLRLYHPNHIKRFVGLKAAAKKPEVHKALKEMFGFDSTAYSHREADVATDMSGDIADAYILARLLIVELQLRKGIIQLTDLSDTQIEIFNSVSKGQSENLLVRNWDLP